MTWSPSFAKDILRVSPFAVPPALFFAGFYSCDIKSGIKELDQYVSWAGPTTVVSEIVLISAMLWLYSRQAK